MQRIAGLEPVGLESHLRDHCDRVRVTVIAAGFEGREWTEPAQVRVERQAEPLFGEREEEGAFEEDDLEIPDFLRT